MASVETKVAEERPQQETTRAKTAVSYLEAIRQALWEEMERDPSVFLIGEDIGRYGGAFKLTDGFQQHFGKERVIDAPIAEAAIVGAAIGASHMGFKPVAEMQFIDFIAPAFDMIVNFAAKSRYRWGAAVPIVIRGPCGGGGHGGPFHSQNPEAYFLNVPGLKIVAPATPTDAKGLLVAAIRDPDPVLYLEHKYLYRRVKEVLPDEEYTVPIGKAKVAREGKDLTIVTFGAMLHKSLEAAQAIAQEDGAEIEVVDLRTLLPLDSEAIAASVKKTNRVLVVHEASKTGGIGGELTARVCELAFEWLDAPPRRVTGPDTPVPYAPGLEEYYLVQVDDILKASRWMLEY